MSKKECERQIDNLSMYLSELDIQNHGVESYGDPENLINIIFESVLDAERFVDYVAPRYESSSKSLYQSISLAGLGKTSSWKVNVRLRDSNQEISKNGEIIKISDDNSLFNFDITICFPISDLNEINYFLDQAVENYEGEFNFDDLMEDDAEDFENEIESKMSKMSIKSKNPKK